MSKNGDMPHWQAFVEKQKNIIEKAKKKKNTQNAKSGGKVSDKGYDKKE